MHRADYAFFVWKPSRMSVGDVCFSLCIVVGVSKSCRRSFELCCRRTYVRSRGIVLPMYSKALRTILPSVRRMEPQFGAIGNRYLSYDHLECRFSLIWVFLSSERPFKAGGCKSHTRSQVPDSLGCLVAETRSSFPSSFLVRFVTIYPFLLGWH